MADQRLIEAQQYGTVATIAVIESIGEIHALAMEGKSSVHGGLLFEVKVPHAQESFEVSISASVLRR